MSSTVSSKAHLILRILVLAGACFLAGQLGVWLTSIGGQTLIWPSSGVALAVLVTWGTPVWPGVWLGAFAISYVGHESLVFSLIFSSGHTLAFTLAAFLLRRRKFDSAFALPRDLGWFAALALVAGPLASALAGTLAFSVSEAEPHPEIWSTVVTGVLGEGIGVLLVAPFLLCWSTGPPWSDHRRLREAGALLLALTVVILTVWGWSGPEPLSLALALLTFPLLIWAAMGFGIHGAAAAAILLSVAATWGTARGSGPFVRVDPSESAVYLWTFLAVATFTALAVAIFFDRYRVSAVAAQSQERLKLALAGAEDGIWDWDLRTHEMVFDERWAAMLGYELEEIEPSWEGWIDLVHPDDAPGVKKALEAHLGEKIPLYQTEHRMRDSGGQWRWILARGKIVERDDYGRPIRVSGTHKDITERKNAREALLRSEALIRAILETAPDGVITLSHRGTIESFNAAAERIFGYSAPEILGKNVSTLMLPEEEERFRERFLGTESPRLGRPQEFVGRRRDGVAFPFELSMGEMQVGESRLFTGMIRDITARKEAEEDLKLYRAMVQNTSEGVQLTRVSDEMIVYANPALEKMFDYESGELMGHHVSTIYAAGQEGTGELLHQANEHLARQGIWRGEVQAVKKDGTAFWSRVRISTFDHPKFGPLWVSVHEDITEQMRSDEERRWLEEQLRQAYRMESIGQLAGGMAHEFNNLLVVIGGHLGFALRAAPDTGTLRSDLAEAQGAVERAAALAQKLLAFSRRQELERIQADLNEVVHRTVPMLRTAVQENVEIKFEPGHKLAGANVDVSQIEQVLLNLAVNARDAMPDGGSLVITTANAAFDREFCRQHPWAQPGHYVKLAVSDGGRGMDDSTLDQIFEPFFTTKEASSGTGLGLAVVHGIVRQHEALIHVESTRGEGSTFTTYWPQVAGRAEKLPVKDVVTAKITGAGTLILAEDDETVRKVAGRFLEEAGYRVLTANNGEEAVELFEEWNKSVDLVILDLIMPVMGGLAARQKILELRSDVRILLSSGYSTAPVHPGPGGIEIPLIAKPFDQQTLLARVREALTEGRPSGSDVAVASRESG